MNSRSISVDNDTLVAVSGCHCKTFLITMAMQQPDHVSTIHIP